MAEGAHRNVEEAEDRINREITEANRIVQEYNSAVNKTLELVERLYSKIKKENN